MSIKSRFVYFPEENHWVLQPQNASMAKEFFKWLKETL
jgi:dipeptidyl aminopeptidase/acylaminoacyl peptidase